MKDITVIITGAGAPGAPGIIKSLRIVNERKINIIGVDANENSVGFSMVDKYYVIPLANDDNFIDVMIDICEKEKVDVVIPLVTRELMKFALNKHKFEKIGTAISVSEHQSLEIANNKYLLLEKCNTAGIPVPKFIKVNNFDQFEEAVYKLGYPYKNVCFKPPISNGMRGFRILAKEIDRLNLLLNEKPMNVITTLEDVSPILKKTESFPELIVMEYLPGDEYSV
ncbi:MAG: hypothetical protein ACPL7B_08700, partial [Candidatus Poribacteria bacterium]